MKQISDLNQQKDPKCSFSYTFFQKCHPHTTSYVPETYMLQIYSWISSQNFFLHAVGPVRRKPGILNKSMKIVSMLKTKFSLILKLASPTMLN